MEVWSQVIGRIVGGCTEAVDTLLRVMSDDDAQAAAKVGASRALLEFAARGIARP